MSVFKGFVIAFSMFSKIPMPFLEWNEKDLKYVYCFLPLVGCVIAALEMLLYYFCGKLEINFVFRAAIMTCLPIFLTGGIHLDGFMDTEDALCSHKDSQAMLSIMDDPRTGAFAVIRLAVVLMLVFGSFCAIGSYKSAAAAAICFIMVRAMACGVIASMDCAKQEGMLYSFVKCMNKPIVALFTVVWLMLSLAAMETLMPLWIFPVAVVMLLWCVVFERIVKRSFGGITGDTLGWFITVAEALVLIIVALVGNYI